ncbi:MAG: helix-turn-helix domain-containing protein [Acidimicrobiales bacterium]
MSINGGRDEPDDAATDATGGPDYDLAPLVHAERPEQLKALASPIRKTILDLVLDRAATVSELAEALGRPKSSVAHHVDVLTGVGLLAVVRTRRVRAIDERFYGRTGRTIMIGSDLSPEEATGTSMLREAAAELGDATTDFSTLRHVRISAEHAEAFFARVVELAEDFTRLPRSGSTVYGFIGAVYPTEQPVLPNNDRVEQP